jgi:hypothetical protein
VVAHLAPSPHTSPLPRAPQEDETKFQRAHRLGKYLRMNTKRLVAAYSLFFSVVPILEYTRPKTVRLTEVLFGACYFVVLLALALLLVTHKTKAMNAPLVLCNVLLAGAAQVAILVVPCLCKDTGPDPSDIIFYVLSMALICNCRVLNALQSFVFTVTALVAWFATIAALFVDSPILQGEGAIFTLTLALCGLFSVARIEYFDRKMYTNAVQSEQQKGLTDEVLFSMLPRFAAKIIQIGQARVSEKYEQVTILYSDVKGAQRDGSPSWKLTES